jgi:carbon monoxide dehydrogenase subunit G
MAPPRSPRPHRYRARLALGAIAVALAAAPLSAVRADTPRADVRVTQSGRVFVIEASFEAPVPPALAWQVLTDFERMETFVPNLADSRIIVSEDQRLTILQHGIARFGPLTARFESERVVTLTPPTVIRSVQTRGTMDKLESVTTFTPSPTGTRLAYHVEVVPGALFPDVLTRHFLDHEVREQFEAIVREMVRRKNASGG